MLKLNIPWTQVRPGDRLVCDSETVIIVLAVTWKGQVWDHKGNIWNPRGDEVMVIRKAAKPEEPYGAPPSVLQIQFEDRSRHLGQAHV